MNRSTRSYATVVSVCLLVSMLMVAALPVKGADVIKMELGVNSWGNAVIQAIRDGVARFEAIRPGVEVGVNVVSGDSLLVRVAGGAPPDVAAVGMTFLGGYVETGVVIPLDSFIDKDLREQIIPAVDQLTWQDPGVQDWSMVSTGHDLEYRSPSGCRAFPQGGRGHDVA